MLPEHTIFWAFYQQQTIQSLSLEKLNILIDEFNQQGYLLTNGYAYPFDEPENIIKESGEIQILIESVSQLNQSSSNSFNFWQPNFEFTLLFTNHEKSGTNWMVGVEDKTFIGQTEASSIQNTLKFLEAIKLALTYFSPFYGCTLFSEERPYSDKVFNLEIEEIYEINFYGSSYIQKFSKESLLSAPAWKIEEISEGILLIPSIQAIYDYDAESLARVQEHLIS